MKKKLFLFIVFALVSCVVFSSKNTVYAAQEVDTTSNGKVTDITTSNKIEKTGDNVVTITYTKAELEALKWSTSNKNIGRDTNGWWIGYKVTAPSSVTSDNIDKAVYNTKVTFSGSNVTKKFKDVLDGNYFCNFWAFIDNNVINKLGTDFTLSTTTFDWNGDNTNDLTVIIKVTNAEGVRLKENADGDGKMVNVIIDDVEFDIEKGKTLASMEGLYKTMLESLKKGEPDEKFLGFFRKFNGVELKETDPINEYMVLVTKFEKVQSTVKEDSTPQTGSENNNMSKMMSVIGVLAIISVVATISILLKKRYFTQNR